MAGRKKNIVPCLTFVKQNVANPKPDKVSLDKEELKRIIEKEQEKLNDVEEEPESEDNDVEEDNQDSDFAQAVQKAKKMSASIKKKERKRKKEEGQDDIVDKYGLDEYDEEESSTDFLQGIGGLTPFASNDEDPYITLKNDEDNSDDEDFELKPTDNLIAVGKVTEEAAVLEVHIYNAEQGNLFIHHDYILPTIPLVLEWLDYDVADGQKGNFIAMGTMEPDISIWDLDVVDSLEPVTVLKGSKEKRKKKKIKKRTDSDPQGHTDAVLDLSWNPHVRNVLASASADNTVRIWDLAEEKSVSTLTHHTQQVQCVSWHPVESQSLLTGSFDNTVAVIDCRSPNDNVKTWKVKGEVEKTLWNHFSPFQFFASTDQGHLYCMDIRHETPVYTLAAHQQAVSGLSLSSMIPGLLVTTSADKHFKVWDVKDNKPSLVLSRNLQMDLLHCVSCNQDEPFVFAIGANKNFKVWDIRESAAVRRHFMDRMPQKYAAECEGDEDDLPDVLENLNMNDDDDEQDLADEAEMLAGDVSGNQNLEEDGAEGMDTTTSKKKKKKKKKMKKPKDGEES